MIRKNPNLTKREAQDLMREQKESKNTNGKNSKSKNSGDNEKDEWIKHNHAWFKGLVALANEATRTADALKQCRPDQLNHLLQVVDPSLLVDVRRGGTALIEVADKLAKLLEEPEQTITPVRRAKETKASARVTA